VKGSRFPRSIITFVRFQTGLYYKQGFDDSFVQKVKTSSGKIHSKYDRDAVVYTYKYLDATLSNSLHVHQ